MTNSYKLDDLRRDLDQQYQPLIIEVGRQQYPLRNILRMGQSDRTEIREALIEIRSLLDDEEAGVDLLTPLANRIIEKAVADGKGPALVEHLNGDVAMSMRIINLWTEATHPGEASGSPDSSTSTASS